MRKLVIARLIPEMEARRFDLFAARSASTFWVARVK